MYFIWTPGISILGMEVRGEIAQIYINIFLFYCENYYKCSSSDKTVGETRTL